MSGIFKVSNCTTWSKFIRWKLIIAQVAKKYPLFIEPEGPLLCSQESANLEPSHTHKSFNKACIPRDSTQQIQLFRLLAISHVRRHCVAQCQNMYINHRHTKFHSDRCGQTDSGDETNTFFSKRTQKSMTRLKLEYATSAYIKLGNCFLRRAAIAQSV
jgi:hypothetical protein